MQRLAADASPLAASPCCGLWRLRCLVGGFRGDPTQDSERRRDVREYSVQGVTCRARMAVHGDEYQHAEEHGENYGGPPLPGYREINPAPLLEPRFFHAASSVRRVKDRYQKLDSYDVPRAADCLLPAAYCIPLVRLGHLGNASIAALAPAELRDGRLEVGAGEVGPHPLAEDDLRIGDLPEQAIAQPPFAAAADEQVHVGSGLSDMVRVRQQA